VTGSLRFKEEIILPFIILSFANESDVTTEGSEQAEGLERAMGRMTTT
jgi:hypothetical protein